MRRRLANNGLDRAFPPTDRRGSVLVIVTILVALLTLGAYTFSEFMVVETQAASAFGRDTQAKALADSGVELAAAILSDRTELDPQSLYNNPGRFQGITIRNAPSPRARGMVSLVAGLEYDVAGSQPRFGLVNESSKINLNRLTRMGLDNAQARQLLMGLPLMTEDTADAILDFLDEDATPRELGCEDEYYGQFGITARNGALESLDELLLVRGVTPDLLYGEDANRNGVLDPNENDGERTPPFDNADGTLFPGWIQYLTLFSVEVNTQADGTAKIDANKNALGELYDLIEPVLGQEVATYVVAYRLQGPYDPSQPSSNPSAGGNTMASNTPGGANGGRNMAGGGPGQGGGPGGGSSRGGGAGGGPGGAGPGGAGAGGRGGGGGGGAPGGGAGPMAGGGGGGGAQTVNPSAPNSAATTTPSLPSGGTRTTPSQGSGGATTTTAQQVGGVGGGGGMSAGGGGAITYSQRSGATQVGGQPAGQSTAGSINSMRNTAVQAATTAANAVFSAQGQVTRAGIDLTAGAKVQLNSLYDLIGTQVQVNVNGSPTVLDSPFTADAAAMREYLPKLLDALATNTARTISGRININDARRETLFAIPGMNEQMAEQIVSLQASLKGAGDGTLDLLTPGWLYIHKVADLPTLSALDPYITTGGSVYRVNSVGFFAEGGGNARVEAVIDATQTPAQIVFTRDLSNLGAAYSPQILSGAAASP
jgi:DNA uptake protein ComE-like DNA-binding protein